MCNPKQWIYINCKYLFGRSSSKTVGMDFAILQTVGKNGTKN